MAEIAVTYQRRNASIAGVVIDAAEFESHTFEAAVTDHPVEEGIAVSDHIRPLPVRLEITGTISNTPISLPDDDFSEGASEDTSGEDIPRPPNTFPINALGSVGVAAATGNPAGAVAGLAAAAVAVAADLLEKDSVHADVLKFAPEFNRVGAALSEFLAVIQEGRLFEVVTTLATYPDMAFESLRIGRDVNTGNVLAFSAAMKQIRTVQTSTVEDPTPKVNRALPKKAKGKQASKDADENESAAAQAQSALSALTGLG